MTDRKRSLLFAAVLLLSAACMTAGCGKERSEAENGTSGENSFAQQEASGQTYEPWNYETLKEIPPEEIDFSGGSLLNTTDIKWLTMEAGATVDEIRFNWFSPSAKPGMIELTREDTGKTQYIEAECSPSVTREGYYVNKASVNGLEYGVLYTYRAGNDDAWSPEYSYQMPEDTGNNLTFLVTTDAQLGQSQTEDREITAVRWNDVLNKITSEVPEAQFLFHLGDQVSCFGSGRDYELFLDHKALYSIPLAPIVGNHDVPNIWSIEESGYPDGPYFHEHLNVPNLSELGQTQPGTGDGDYYFIRGNVLFLTLNNECASTSEHEQFVAQVTSEHPEVKWRILAQHYPAYSGVESATAAEDKDWIIALATDYDIDLVLTAHDHSYSRTGFLTREGVTLEGYEYETGSAAADPEGPFFVTCSTSSGCLYHWPVEREEFVFQGQPDTPMAMRIDVTDTELHLTAYLAESWTVYDEYTIQKS